MTPGEVPSMLTYMPRLHNVTTEPAGIPPALENEFGFREGKGYGEDTQTTKKALKGSWQPSPGDALYVSQWL